MSTGVGGGGVGGIGGTARTDITKPGSLMLWKKVQQYVVVGGAFVSSTQAATANNGTVNEQHQSNPQQAHNPQNCQKCISLHITQNKPLLLKL